MMCEITVMCYLPTHTHTYLYTKKHTHVWVNLRMSHTVPTNAGVRSLFVTKTIDCRVKTGMKQQQLQLYVLSCILYNFHNILRVVKYY